MNAISLNFQIHQPNRLKPFTFFDLGLEHFYEDDELNAKILDYYADHCYLPNNNMLLDLIEKTDGRLRVSFSISGTALEQFEHHRPDVLDSFRALAKTGCVEFIGGTYHHSLSYFYSKEDFKRQVNLHHQKIKKYFGQCPKIFHNTALTFNNEMAEFVQRMGFQGIMSEGVDWVLNGRSPNYLYKVPNADLIKVFVRNESLSNDISFNFHNKDWAEYPLSPNKFKAWTENQTGDLVNIKIDYEKLMPHEDMADQSVREFFSNWVGLVCNSKMKFKLPTAIVEQFEVRDEFDAHHACSWANQKKDLSSWTSNDMQLEAVAKIYGLREAVMQTNNPDLINTWSKLQSIDHFEFISTDHPRSDSPYSSPYAAYIYYMNVVSDLQITLNSNKANLENEAQQRGGEEGAPRPRNQSQEKPVSQ